MRSSPNSLIWSTPPRILVYGAGVVGTVLASRLKRAGQNVTVLARGRRLTDIREHGLVLENQSTDERTVTRVAAIEHLAPESTYDVIFVVMRKNQVDAVLPALAAARKVSTICFMVNTASGYTMWGEAVGHERLLLGFPGAGGVRNGPVVRYALAPTWMQPTTFGEPDGQVTARLKAVLRMFRGANLPVTTCCDMRGWLTSHVALVSPLANGIYLAGGDHYRLAKQVSTVRLMVDAIREGFAVVRAAGLNVVPFQLRLVERTPEVLVVAALRAWAGTGHFETVAKAHAIAAVDEMQVLAHEFALLARTAGVRTPAIDRLRDACDIFVRRL